MKLIITKEGKQREIELDKYENLQIHIKGAVFKVYEDKGSRLMLTRDTPPIKRYSPLSGELSPITDLYERIIEVSDNTITLQP